MKKGIVIWLVFVLFTSFSFVSAGGCYDNQTILKFYSGSNSHAAFWNDGTYQYRICFNDTFNYDYTGPNPHECNVNINSPIVYLYSASNSHVDDGSGGYTIPICFGDLVCEVDTTFGNGCDNGGEVIFRMYSRTNSHVSDWDQNVATYRYEVCCNSGGGVGPWWADMSGRKIYEADKGDNIKMVSIDGVSPNTFEVWDSDWLGDTNVRTGISGFNDPVIGGRYVGVWDIAQADVDLALESMGEGLDNFYFLINSEKSYNFRVNNVIDDDPINIILSSPKCGDAFDQGSTVPIQVSASDPDDVIDGKLTIRNSAGAVVYSGFFGNEDKTFNYQFNDPGNFSIVVEADNGRERTRTSVSIMILGKSGGNYVNGRYIAACIVQPKDYSNIPGVDVFFNATASRGVEVNASGKFNVSYADSRLGWLWEFSTGETYNAFYDSNPPGYMFNKKFSSPGSNWARLTLDF